MSEKCPKCGAEHNKTCNPFNERSFSCGAFYDEEGKFFRSRPDCYETEIAALKARLETWRDLADIVRPMYELKAVQKLEEMGEL